MCLLSGATGPLFYFMCDNVLDNRILAVEEFVEREDIKSIDKLERYFLNPFEHVINFLGSLLVSRNLPPATNPEF